MTDSSIHLRTMVTCRRNHILSLYGPFAENFLLYIYIYIYSRLMMTITFSFFFFYFFFFFFFKLRSSKLKSQFHHAPTVFNTQRELLKSKCCRKIKWLRATYRYQSYHQFPQPAFTIRHPLLVPELEYTQNETSSLAQNETYFLFIIARTTVEA